MSNNNANRSQPYSQLDPGGALKNSHDFEGAAFRVRDTVSAVQDFFTHYRVTYDLNDNPTQVLYYLGTQPHKSEIGVTSDFAGSLNNKYFFIYDARTEQKYHIWYNVNSLGVDPNPAGSIGIEVAINTNEDSTIVALATELAINNSYPRIFDARRIGSVVRTTNKRFGLAPDTVNGTTAFFITNTSGEQNLVEQVTISYNGTEPIYEGQELTGYKYNIFTGKFELQSLNVNTEVDLKDPNDYQILNISVPLKGVEVAQVLPTGTKRFTLYVRAEKGNIRLARNTGETGTLYTTINRGERWDSQNTDLANGTTIYFETTQDNMVIELFAWKRL